MKECYEDPVLEIIELSEDIITASNELPPDWLELE